jgi:hypothetical protein
MHSIVSPPLAIAFLFLGLTSLGLAELVDPGDWWVHGAWCIFAALPMVVVFKRLIKAGASILLVDHRVMLCFAFCLYFIVGAALLSFGPESEIVSVLSYYPVGVNEVLRTNAINSIGLFVLLMATYVFHLKSLNLLTKRAAQVYSKFPFFMVFGFFAVVGLMAQYYVYWADTRTSLGGTDFAVAGIARSLAKFPLVAIFLGFIYAEKGSRKYRAAGCILVALTSPAGLLMASKTDFLLPICAALAGTATRRNNVKSLVIGIFVLGVGILASGGAVLNLRSEQSGYTSFDMQSRVESILQSGRSLVGEGNESTYSMWSRFCYSIAQAAAIELYDKGNGGDDFNKLPWLFVPRLLWPSKPIMTDSSVDFHEKITGTRYAAVGIGIFASGYYDGGWVGLILASLLCGLVISATSAIAVSVMSAKSVILYPVALMGIYIAFRIDGSYLNDYCGAMMYVLALIVAPVFSSLAMRQANATN